jgi:hypothetical protein
LTYAINEDLLAQLEQGVIQLDHGSHRNYDEGHCAMEVVAALANLGHTDAPECASEVLRDYTVGLNDSWDATQRQKLIPFLPRMIGTGNDGNDEERSYLALDWLVRSYAPAWLDLAGHTKEAAELRALRRIVDSVSAQAARPVVEDASAKAYAAESAAWSAAGSAAWSAAWSAARSAARSAAEEKLRPTVETLQTSALELLDTMINPSKAAS